MGKKIDWLVGFKGCYECQELNQGLSGIAQSIVYALLVFCVLGTVYACFEKIESEPSFSALPEVERLDLQEEAGLASKNRATDEFDGYYEQSGRHHCLKRVWRLSLTVNQEAQRL